ncbi:MAG: hypothetical protein IT307_03360 [Chloroflexi bacterium]|nr:hypothetical protein [Chloroflexota bacterium]
MHDAVAGLRDQLETRQRLEETRVQKGPLPIHDHDIRLGQTANGLFE